MSELPPEKEIAELRRALHAAQEHARASEEAAGALRGELQEMRLQLARARQDQDAFQLGWVGRARRWATWRGSRRNR